MDRQILSTLENHTHRWRVHSSRLAGGRQIPILAHSEWEGFGNGFTKMAGRELTMGEAMEIAELKWYLSADDGPRVPDAQDSRPA